MFKISFLTVLRYMESTYCYWSPVLVLIGPRTYMSKLNQFSLNVNCFVMPVAIITSRKPFKCLLQKSRFTSFVHCYTPWLFLVPETWKVSGNNLQWINEWRHTFCLGQIYEGQRLLFAMCSVHDSAPSRRKELNLALLSSFIKILTLIFDHVENMLDSSAMFC